MDTLSQRMSKQTGPRLRILFLEDDPIDAELVAHSLRRSDPGSTLLRADTEESFTEALDTFAPDVILSDHAVAHFNALDALRHAQRQRPECPFILVAGSFEHTSAECLKAGAIDFVSKSDLSSLSSIIATALAERAELRTLSNRQIQVLQLLATGSSTREIAGRLQLSVKTVETHRAQIMKRLSISDLVGLVRYAIRVGLVSAQQ